MIVLLFRQSKVFYKIEEKAEWLSTISSSSSEDEEEKPKPAQKQEKHKEKTARDSEIADAIAHKPLATPAVRRIAMENKVPLYQICLAVI